MRLESFFPLLMLAILVHQVIHLAQTLLGCFNASLACRDEGMCELEKRLFLLPLVSIAHWGVLLITVKVVVRGEHVTDLQHSCMAFIDHVLLFSLFNRFGSWKLLTQQPNRSFDTRNRHQGLLDSFMVLSKRGANGANVEEGACVLS